jgi:hypothetical protein
LIFDTGLHLKRHSDFAGDSHGPRHVFESAVHAAEGVVLAALAPSR